MGAWTNEVTVTVEKPPAPAPTPAPAPQPQAGKPSKTGLLMLAALLALPALAKRE